jgi:hypothetical protein
MALGWDARGLKRIGVGLALISQRIKPRGANDRRREPSKAFHAQGRNTPVLAMLGIAEVVAGEIAPVLNSSNYVDSAGPPELS